MHNMPLSKYLTAHLYEVNIIQIWNAKPNVIYFSILNISNMLYEIRPLTCIVLARFLFVNIFYFQVKNCPVFQHDYFTHKR